MEDDKCYSLTAIHMRVVQLERDRQRLDQRLDEHPEGPILQRIKILELDAARARSDLKEAREIAAEISENGKKAYWLTVTSVITALLTVGGSAAWFVLDKYFQR